MRIEFSPQRRDGVLSVSKDGDTLLINGSSFDFSALPEGASIDAEDVPTSWLSGQVLRRNGEIQLQLVIPIGPNPPPGVAYPELIEEAQDGILNIPADPYFEGRPVGPGEDAVDWAVDLSTVQYPAPPIYVPSVPSLCAIANFQMLDGDVASIDLTSGFSIIFAVAPGTVWAFFETPMADLGYSWNINSTDGRVRVTNDRTTDYLEIEAKDDSGEPLSGATVALQVYKVNS